jgi:hypothetical protein
MHDWWHRLHVPYSMLSTLAFCPQGIDVMITLQPGMAGLGVLSKQPYRLIPYVA